MPDVTDRRQRGWFLPAFFTVSLVLPWCGLTAADEGETTVVRGLAFAALVVMVAAWVGYAVYRLGPGGGRHRRDAGGSRVRLSDRWLNAITILLVIVGSAVSYAPTWVILAWVAFSVVARSALVVGIQVRTRAERNGDGTRVGGVPGASPTHPVVPSEAG